MYNCNKRKVIRKILYLSGYYTGFIPAYANKKIAEILLCFFQEIIIINSFSPHDLLVTHTVH